MNAEKELNEKLNAIAKKEYFNLNDFGISKTRYYFGIFGEAIIIFLMYAIPLSVFGLAIYGLYRLVTE